MRTFLCSSHVHRTRDISGITFGDYVQFHLTAICGEVGRTNRLTVNADDDLIVTCPKCKAADEEVWHHLE